MGSIKIEFDTETRERIEEALRESDPKTHPAMDAVRARLAPGEVAQLCDYLSRRLRAYLEVQVILRWLPEFVKAMGIPPNEIPSSATKNLLLDLVAGDWDAHGIEHLIERCWLPDGVETASFENAYWHAQAVLETLATERVFSDLDKELAELVNGG